MACNGKLLFRNAATAGALGLALLAAASGCASRDDVNGPESDPRAAAIPDDPPHISGTITVIQPGDSVVRTDGTRNPDGPVSCPPTCGSTGSALRSVLIEETPGGHGDNKSYVKVPREAVILEKSSAGTTRIGFSDLQVGQRVESWFTGPVAESYPTQATAAVIVVLR